MFRKKNKKTREWKKIIETKKTEKNFGKKQKVQKDQIAKINRKIPKRPENQK